MAVFHGKRGLFTFTGINANQDALINSFTIDATADTVETTVLDASAVAAATHWKDYVIGFKDWTATINCFLDSAGIAIAALGTEQTLTIDTTDGLAYAGTAILTGVSIGGSADAAGTVNLTFQGTAQLAGT
jgi:hypothetical protein